MNALRAPALAPQLAAEYELELGAQAWLLAERAHARALAEAGLGAERDPAWSPSALGGRSPLREFRAAGERVLVRAYRRGGLLGRWRGHSYASPQRLLDELELAQALRAHGVRTPLPVAGRARRLSAGRWQLELCTLAVADACDLAERWAELADAPRARRALCRELGAWLRALHALGLRHADLQPKNALIERGSGALWILDLDRGRLGGALELRERAAALARFQRWIDKHLAPGERPARSARARFWRAYEPERAARRKLWRAAAAVLRRGRLWHARARS